MILRRTLIYPLADHHVALLNDSELPGKLRAGCDRVLKAITDAEWPLAWLADELEGLRERLGDHAQGPLDLKGLDADVRGVHNLAAVHLGGKAA